MGQQQLLLIVLGVIIVGIAVAVGINLFSASATEANREQLVSVLTSLGIMAQEYYQKSVMLDGGNRKFKGWKIPKFYREFEAGKIKVKFNKKEQEVTITATGTAKGRDNKKKVKVEAKVKPTFMRIKTLN